jgi:hypothetical protein
MSDFVGMKQPSVEAWAKWSGLLSERLESGQSAAVFCRERGLAVWAFCLWKKRVREAEAAKFLEVAVKPVKPGSVVSRRRKDDGDLVGLGLWKNVQRKEIT